MSEEKLDTDFLEQELRDAAPERLDIRVRTQGGLCHVLGAVRVVISLVR